MSLFHVNDDSYFKDWGWNILCKRLRVNSHMIAPMKKGLLWQIKLFTMLFYIHVGTC